MQNSNPNPIFQSIRGVGLPRLILVLSKPYGYILNSAIGNPGIINTVLEHGLTNGQQIAISGHSGSTPSINNTYAIQSVPSSKVFTIPVNITVGGTGGRYDALTDIYVSTGVTSFDATHAYESGGATFPNVTVNNLVSGIRTAGGLDNPTYAKVTAKATGVLSIDGWTNGIPTAASAFRINGWVCDLPRTGEGGLTEIFDPDVLIHSLYAGDAGSKKVPKHRGWKYSAVLDYSKYLSPDTLLNMRHILAPRPNDQLILIPRLDMPGIQINVYYGDKIQLAKYGISPGYKKGVFVFQGTENLASWQMVDGYGTAYATNYGTCL